MDLKATVISGEAPESDDDASSIIATGLGFPSMRAPSTYCGTIISGEAPESDDDLTSLSSISGAMDAMACPPYTDLKIAKSKRSSIKYNSLLHKKLHECNETLDRDILQMTEGTIANSVQDLSTVNRQLLRSELVLQEAVCQLRNASSRIKDTSHALHQLINDNFLNSIKT
ncbi:biogenesis of lysosome-related organelles complex 1 subunit 3 [Polyergus mexicanus]|uniref:biogenesis of lysosome-related organelles complex 1 subunit 3 n=1 Tax=Polyergus mexicanus TaxID=615972 RepID=UPI0038B55724